jgi:hypothetical protein
MHNNVRIEARDRVGPNRPARTGSAVQPSAFDTLERMHRRIVSPAPRRRGAPSADPLFVGIAVVAAMSLIACGYRSPLGTSSSPGVSEPAGTNQAGGSATAGVDGAPGASDDKLTVTVALGRAEVEPGASVTIAVTVHNGRSVPVVLSVDQCGAPATMYAVVPVPVGPSGRDWDGIAGDFKTYALTEGYREGGAPATAPGWVYATVRPCRERGSELTLAPGDTASSSMTWTAAIVDGVPAAPGQVPFKVTVGHDPTGAPPSNPPGHTGPLGSWFRTYAQLVVDGTIRIGGDAPNVLTAGQALDAMLADRRFSAWLSERPKGTWSGANVFLLNYGAAQGIVPAGPSWEIDLFRETGVPRNWAIGFVDPFTGTLRNLAFCNAPCNR